MSPGCVLKKGLDSNICSLVVLLRINGRVPIYLPRMVCLDKRTEPLYMSLCKCVKKAGKNPNICPLVYMFGRKDLIPI